MTGTICDGNGHCDFSKLTNLASKVGKSVTYHPLLGFLCACFMVYTIFKAAIQIGVRMFKMMIMQLIAPIAITAIIGEGMKSQTFQRFIKTYFSVYIEAFIRMFAMFLVSVFVCKFFVNIGDFFADIKQDDWFATTLVTIIIILAAYKFAGDIPAFLDKFIGKQFFAGKENKNFVGAMLGAGLGFLAGASTRTLGGAISGLVGGFQQGGKGNSIADLVKGARQTSENARNVAANQRMTGGRVPLISSMRYGLARAGGALGIPQRRLERGKLAGERQTAMDNMIKTLEDGYDRKVKINGQEVGINRDLFRTYAYDPADGNGFFGELTDEAQKAVIQTNTAEQRWRDAASHYEELYSSGATEGQLRDAKLTMDSARASYDALKASSDKKVDTSFDSMMIRDVRRHPIHMVKKKTRAAVRSAMHSYNNVADRKYTAGKIGSKRRDKSTTKTAGDTYTRQQNRANARAASWTNSNSRGSGGSGGGSSSGGSK